MCCLLLELLERRRVITDKIDILLLLLYKCNIFCCWLLYYYYITWCESFLNNFWTHNSPELVELFGSHESENPNQPLESNSTNSIILTILSKSAWILNRMTHNAAFGCWFYIRNVRNKASNFKQLATTWIYKPNPGKLFLQQKQQQTLHTSFQLNRGDYTAAVDVRDGPHEVARSVIPPLNLNIRQAATMCNGGLESVVLFRPLQFISLISTPSTIHGELIREISWQVRMRTCQLPPLHGWLTL